MRGYAVPAAAATVVAAGLIHQWTGGGLVPTLSQLALPAAMAVCYSALGALVLAHRPGHRVGRLMTVVGGCATLAVLAVSWPGWAPTAWVAQWAWWPPIGLIPALLLIFPDEGAGGREPRARRPQRLLGRRRRPYAIGLIVVALLPAVALALATLPGGRPLLAGDAPTGTGLLFLRLAWLGIAATALGLLGVLVALVVRFRAADLPVRRQLLCLGAAGVTVLLGELLDTAGVPVAWVAEGVALPLALTVAILRLGLYDLDVYVNRALVWLLMSTGVTAAYVLIVGVVLHQGVSLPVLALTALVATCFEPVRRLLQRAVDRLLFGHRDDPYAVLSRLGRHLEEVVAPAEALPRLVAAITDELRVPYAAVRIPACPTTPAEPDRATARIEPVRSPAPSTPAAHPAPSTAATQPAPGAAAADVEPGRLAAPDHPATLIEHGRPVVPAQEFPLVTHRQEVGALLVSPRRAGDEFTRAERRLLRALARQAAVAVDAHRLTLDLQRSRERIVLAREEERRRLRTDLHDGLGPGLAGMAMQVRAARRHVDPAGRDLLEQLGRDLEACGAEVRHLVDRLHPPALDHGLPTALRREASRLSAGPLTITVDCPDDLGDLPAAVEVAALRIVAEAITNAAKHSGGTTCAVTVARTTTALELVVTDDGPGEPPVVGPGGIQAADAARTYHSGSGVGLGSMRERAEELSGVCTIGPAAPHGTRVVARIPIAPSASRTTAQGAPTTPGASGASGARGAYEKGEIDAEGWLAGRGAVGQRPVPARLP